MSPSTRSLLFKAYFDYLRSTYSRKAINSPFSFRGFYKLTDNFLNKSFLSFLKNYYYFSTVRRSSFLKFLKFRFKSSCFSFKTPLFIKVPPLAYTFKIRRYSLFSHLSFNTNSSRFYDSLDFTFRTFFYTSNKRGVSVDSVLSSLCVLLLQLKAHLFSFQSFCTTSSPKVVGKFKGVSFNKFFSNFFIKA